MHIQLLNIGRKFGREWIFRNANFLFLPGKPAVILGSNGSGKSTLLQVISGSLMQSEGQIGYSLDDKKIVQEDLYRHISMAAPYLELMEEFTLEESIRFHGKFKRWKNNYDTKMLLELSGLIHAKDKELRNFSSGMKQRVRLLLAILSDTPLLLLDEPCANLDVQGHEWYAHLIRRHSENRTIIVCSNQQEEEYFFCTEQLRMEDFKK